MERPTETPSQQAEASGQACEPGTLKADLPAPVKPSEDSSLLGDPEPELPSQATPEFLIHRNYNTCLLL